MLNKKHIERIKLSTVHIHSGVIVSCR